MHSTARVRTLAGLTAFLAAFGVVIERFVPLGAATLLGCWLLSRRYCFDVSVARTAQRLSVTRSPAARSVPAAEPLPVTVVVSVAVPTSLSLSVDVGFPTATATTDGTAIELDPGETAAERRFEVTWPVTGSHEFRDASVTVTDGLFRKTIRTGDAPTVTVEPRAPRSIHVGDGGDRASPTLGERDSGRFGSGIEPGELRAYVPGERATAIDWKATARLGSLHVREYDPTTIRRTLLVIDHRSTLATGPPGATALAYLREVAQSIVITARRAGDPLGLRTVGADGLTVHTEPTLTAETYATIRRTLFDLEPASSTATDATVTDATAFPPGPGRSSAPSGRLSRHARGRTTRPVRSSGSRRVGTIDSRRALAALDAESGAFAETLAPFAAPRPGPDRIDSNPLLAAVSRATERGTDRTWTVVCTDDSRRSELRDAVELASRHHDDVLVLLAPSVLFEPGGLADLERAYDRYVAFERFRRRLSRIERVTALEVAPADRVSAVLEPTRVGGGRW